MKVKELTAKLNGFNQDAEVLIWNANNDMLEVDFIEALTDDVDDLSTWGILIHLQCAIQ